MNQIVELTTSWPIKNMILFMDHFDLQQCIFSQFTMAMVDTTYFVAIHPNAGGFTNPNALW